jgi:hypothetical protein
MLRAIKPKNVHAAAVRRFFAWVDFFQASSMCPWRARSCTSFSKQRAGKEHNQGQHRQQTQATHLQYRAHERVQACGAPQPR